MAPRPSALIGSRLPRGSRWWPVGGAGWPPPPSAPSHALWAALDAVPVQVLPLGAPSPLFLLGYNGTCVDKLGLSAHCYDLPEASISHPSGRVRGFNPPVLPNISCCHAPCRFRAGEVATSPFLSQVLSRQSVANAMHSPCLSSIHW